MQNDRVSISLIRERNHSIEFADSNDQISEAIEEEIISQV